MPDPQDLIPRIVARLGRDADEDDLVLWVCDQTGLDWTAAQALINDAKTYHGREINRRRTPVRLTLGGLVFVAGIGLTVYPLYTLVIQVNRLRLSGDQALAVGLVQLLDPGFLTMLGLGVAMMVGSGLALGEQLVHWRSDSTGEI
ncbi:MAG TPA: hypothetical protein PKG95_01945 [Anaerolineaceae bacterium]|jgi:hypothetical protein|nr:hypothetical protein [Anaerolineaceae bacterium]